MFSNKVVIFLNAQHREIMLFLVDIEIKLENMNKETNLFYLITFLCFGTFAGLDEILHAIANKPR